MPVTGRQITVRGRVQGVGFRPFVWWLAREAGLTGCVRNAGTGVLIDAWGSAAALDAFLDRLKADAPPLAQVEALAWRPLDVSAPTTDFRIAASDAGDVWTQVAPDAATCEACLAEIRDRGNRRFHYPFTNCTHCGPRLSIVEGIPYDRAATSMRAFSMCDGCRREYEDPADRRFHAQPIACPICGPRLWLENQDGKIECEDPLAETARLIGKGAIVAIKGIGGFHLACDAMNAETVTVLRRRKGRVAKPLAVMATNLDQIRRFCHLSAEEEELLASPAAPIVLLRNGNANALPGIAPDLGATGFMLPYSPLHQLLLDALDAPIVLTSANLSGTPQVTRNSDARLGLAGLVDAWVFHDRGIVNRLDDSVARIVLGAPVIVRRGRGLAPGAIRLNHAFAAAPPTLALGAELKSTFCILKGGLAIPSQHIGDLKNAETFAECRAQIERFRELFRFDPEVIAVDQHPDYLSTKLGAALVEESGARLVAVQHHHAHLASCLAEHRIAPDEDRTVGIILDGTGLGTDGTVWGGEILLGGYGGFERKAHFAPVALTGGERAVFEPWRNTLAHLLAAVGPDWQVELDGTDLSRRLEDKPVGLITQMIKREVNSPPCSSAGRLFDAVAGALGVAFEVQSYEGQAAMTLEAIAQPHSADAGSYAFDVSGDGVISFQPLWTALSRDLKAGIDSGIIAARFHNGLIAVLVDSASSVASEAGTSRVVLSGGVMQNRLMLEGLSTQLASRGLDVLVPRQVPVNDGGISLGQAAVAAFFRGAT